jgi:hypothetical protein
MEKLQNFISKWGILIIFILIVLETCTSTSRLKSIEKKLVKEIDTLNTSLVLLDKQLQKEIKVEGLKSEKRMIQSTDRKIMDLLRQVEIDKELKQLEKQ